MSSYFINACMRQSPTPADGGVARKDFVTSPIAGNDVVYRADAYYNAAAAASLYQGHGRPLPNVVHPGYDKIGVPSVFQHVGFGAASARSVAMAFCTRDSHGRLLLLLPVGGLQMLANQTSMAGAAATDDESSTTSHEPLQYTATTTEYFLSHARYTSECDVTYVPVALQKRRRLRARKMRGI